MPFFENFGCCPEILNYTLTGGMGRESRASHSGEGGMGRPTMGGGHEEHPPYPSIFFETPYQNQCPHGPPSEKQLIAHNFTNKGTPSQVFFNSILSPHASPMYWLEPPLVGHNIPTPMFSTPVGKPGVPPPVKNLLIPLPPPRKIPTSSYNPFKTALSAVVIVPVPFLF